MQVLLQQAAQQLVRSAAQVKVYSSKMFVYMQRSSSGLAELASLAAGVSSVQQVRDAAHGFWDDCMLMPSVGDHLAGSILMHAMLTRRRCGRNHHPPTHDAVCECWAA
jgi:hypothetical protein